MNIFWIAPAITTVICFFVFLSLIIYKEFAADAAGRAVTLWVISTVPAIIVVLLTYGDWHEFCS